MVYRDTDNREQNYPSPRFIYFYSLQRLARARLYISHSSAQVYVAKPVKREISRFYIYIYITIRFCTTTTTYMLHRETRNYPGIFTRRRRCSVLIVFYMTVLMRTMGFLQEVSQSTTVARIRFYDKTKREKLRYIFTRAVVSRI